MGQIDKISGTIFFSFTGRNGAGAISVPGLKVGDRLVRLIQDGATDYTADLGMMEWVVTVDDEIQQNSGGNTTTWNFEAIALR